MAPYCEDIIMSEIEIREVGIRAEKTTLLLVLVNSSPLSTPVHSNG